MGSIDVSRIQEDLTMTSIRLQAGQLWGKNSDHVVNRRVILVEGHSVAFREEKRTDRCFLQAVAIADFVGWIRVQQAILFECDMHQSWSRASDEEIGKRLLIQRVQAGLSQGDVAQKTGLSRAAIALWEGGKRGCSIRNLSRVAVAIGVDFDTLIRSASSKNGETFEELSLEDRRLLGLFRVVDITSRAEVMRWLEIRASAQSVLRRRGDPFTNQLWHLYSSLAQS
ncbi:transcriptional regulator [Acetobacter aceti NBRC 14818]|uniref:Transcriptional regulator n=2 Tax=Acetobacter TaxID=434 RepID=A0AB33IHT4_ACEAC|nr:transcriptional regulator [Acetobacter aceti NBRC 14818]